MAGNRTIDGDRSLASQRQIEQSARVGSPSAESLAENDCAVIEGCLNAAVNGPFFPECEFHTLFGLTRSEVAAVLATWPDLPEGTPSGYDSPGHFRAVAVNNALNNLLGYPHGVRGDAFVSEVRASEPQVAATMSRWRSRTAVYLRPASATRRAEDRLWAAAFALAIVGGTAWLLFEIGVAPVVVGIPGAMLVALGGVTVVVLSIKEVRRDHGSVGAAAKRGARTLWEWVVDFVP